MTLYLKYRPKDFESLEGQTFIKQTLRQAVAQDRLVGAYLFCGPRGTGKTSTARIFAKAVNCLHPENGNPCGKCDICKNFDAEKLVDIIEIDAASYTGVDNVREIIERASFVPNVCKYKVYIIDEVHMLSKGAFNALLKILEEPPSHLKFILATTESHKIPETILSRCQRYDFKSIAPNDVKERLLFIAKSEGITIDEESMAYIIKQSNGGLRNAISLFEQLIVNNSIDFSLVTQNFGIPTQEKLENFYQKILSQDTSLISDFQALQKEGNPNLFYKELLFLLRDKMIENIESAELKNIVFYLDTLQEAYLKSKNSFDPNTTLTVGLVKILKGADFFALSQDTQVVKKAPEKVISSPSFGEKTIPKTPVVQESLQTIASLENIELTPDDLFDVFGDEGGFDAPTEQIPQADIPKTSPAGNISCFDKEKLITLLKNLGAKGSITMSLRGSDVSFVDGKILSIGAKTTISRNQLGQADSIALITQACQQMGLGEVDVKIF